MTDHAGKRSYVIDGGAFSTLEGFYDGITSSLIPCANWGHNLNALDDILRGGFGTPDGGFVIRWTNSAQSKTALGYSETIRQLNMRLAKCHPSNRPSVQADLERALAGDGLTVFDWVVDIIRDHGPGGREASDGVELILE